MESQTINIALPKVLMRAIDQAAQKEYRNRSEFIREAVYRYLKDRLEWEQIFRAGRAAGRKLGITSAAQVNRIVEEYRRRGR